MHESIQTISETWIRVCRKQLSYQLVAPTYSGTFLIVSQISEEIATL
jgi:hypothetical protein